MCHKWAVAKVHMLFTKMLLLHGLQLKGQEKHDHCTDSDSSIISQCSYYMALLRHIT